MGNQNTSVGKDYCKSDLHEFNQPLTGLENRTNTICYANSVLQVLYHNHIFRDIVLNSSEKGGVLPLLKDLYQMMSKNKKTNNVLSPKKLMNYVQGKNELLQEDRHQDCHQFYMWLVNEINDELVKKVKASTPNYDAKKHLTTLEKDMFGVRTTRTICNKCRQVSERDEMQMDLSLHLPQPNVSISHCIKNYSAEEQMKGEDRFFCDKCKGLQDAKKKTLLKTLPRSLTVHLKRFKYDQRIKGLSKILWQIAFPLQLRLRTNYDEKGEQQLYRLYGIIVHIGQGNKHGHYISIIKIKNRWVRFNDDDIEVVDEHTLQKLFGNKNSSFCAYMLFYEK